MMATLKMCTLVVISLSTFALCDGKFFNVKAPTLKIKKIGGAVKRMNVPTQFKERKERKLTDGASCESHSQWSCTAQSDMSISTLTYSQYSSDDCTGEAFFVMLAPDETFVQITTCQVTEQDSSLQYRCNADGKITTNTYTGSECAGNATYSMVDTMGDFANNCTCQVADDDYECDASSGFKTEKVCMGDTLMNREYAKDDMECASSPIVQLPSNETAMCMTDVTSMGVQLSDNVKSVMVNDCSKMMYGDGLVMHGLYESANCSGDAKYFMKDDFLEEDVTCDVCMDCWDACDSYPTDCEALTTSLAVGGCAEPCKASRDAADSLWDQLKMDAALLECPIWDDMPNIDCWEETCTSANWVDCETFSTAVAVGGCAESCKASRDAADSFWDHIYENAPQLLQCPAWQAMPNTPRVAACVTSCSDVWIPAMMEIFLGPFIPPLYFNQICPILLSRPAVACSKTCTGEDVSSVKNMMKMCAAPAALVDDVGTTAAPTTAAPTTAAPTPVVTATTLPPSPLNPVSSTTMLGRTGVVMMSIAFAVIQMFM